MEYQVSARKYRPGSFDQVIGQPHVVQTIKNAIGRNQVAHAYVFSGMRGVGKTTIARIVAKALNCEQGPTSDPCETCPSCEEITRGQSVDVIEIDGASNTGVDDVRELRENVKFAPFRGGYRVYIIDEVHMLSNSAFNALLKTLEEPPSHAVFIFATTEVHKIPATILSRCQHFTFRRIPRLEVIRQLQHVVKQVGATVEDRSLAAIAKTSDGSMRDALSLLDQALAFGGDEIRHDALEALLGAVPDELVRNLVESLINQDASAGISFVGQAFDQGYDVRIYCREILERIRNVLIAAIVPTAEQVQSLVELPREEVETIMAQAQRVDEGMLQEVFQIFSKAEERLRMSSHPRFVLEAAVVQATQLGKVPQAQEVQVDPRPTSTMSASSTARSAIQDPPRVVRDDRPQIRPKVPERPARSLSSKSETTTRQPVDRKAAKTLIVEKTKEPQRVAAAVSAAPAPASSSAPESPQPTSCVDWEQVMDQVMKSHPNIGTFLEMGTLVQLEPQLVMIGYPKNASVARWRIDKPENRKLIGEICQSVVGHPVNVRVVEMDRAQAAVPTIGDQRAKIQEKEDQSLIEEARANPMVKQTLEMFGGEVVSARRVSPTEEKG